MAECDYDPGYDAKIKRKNISEGSWNAKSEYKIVIEWLKNADVRDPRLKKLIVFCVMIER